MKNIYIKYKIIIILLLLLLFIGYYVYYKYSLNEPFTTENKICCIYAYHEKNDLYKNNFVHFLNNGGILNDIDYYIVVNGNCTVTIPNKPNIKVFFRENKGFDFGAFSYALNNHINIIYDYYFFINTSVIGPCLQNNAETNWTKYFIDLFYNENIKVVGTTINMHSIPDNDLKKSYILNYGDKNVYSHVQSMFFCIKHDYLLFLKEKDFFNCDEINNLQMKDIIYLKEVGLSQIALNNGWNINCILSKYKNLDYLNLNTDINSTSTDGDPYYPNKYFGNTINPYEVIFFKNNRF
jgi:hypothetical protein